jgi:hypothetical protein
MAQGHRFHSDLGSAVNSGCNVIRQPEDGGTFQLLSRSDTHCSYDATGAQSAVLPDATKFGVGTSITICLKSGGSLALTQEGAGRVFAVSAAGGNAALGTAGDWIKFVVVRVGGGNQWRLAGHDGGDFS